MLDCGVGLHSTNEEVMADGSAADVARSVSAGIRMSVNRLPGHPSRMCPRLTGGSRLSCLGRAA